MGKNIYVAGAALVTTTIAVCGFCAKREGDFDSFGREVSRLENSVSLAIDKDKLGEAGYGVMSSGETRDFLNYLTEQGVADEVIMAKGERVLMAVNKVKT